MRDLEVRTVHAMTSPVRTNNAFKFDAFGRRTAEKCVPSSSKRSYTIAEKYGLFDGTAEQDICSKIAERMPWLDNIASKAPEHLRRHGPIASPGKLTLTEQRRLLNEKLAKQASIRNFQLDRCERVGRSIDIDAVLACDDRVDEMDPKDLGADDCKAKLKHWEVEQAERMEEVRQDELRALHDRVKAAEEKTSVNERSRDCASHPAAKRALMESIDVDVENWQRVIQANHRELTERKGKRKAKFEDDGILDTLAGDEAELEGFSSEASEEDKNREMEMSKDEETEDLFCMV